MYRLPGDHIAFVFSDTAGANACIAMAKISEIETGAKVDLYSNKKNSAAGDRLIVSEKIPEFQGQSIDCVFTGTSHPESSGSFEVNSIRQAVKDNIHTISFIDHWVNFKLRFEGLERSELPDEIWVVDDRARELAIADGLPPEKLVVKDNPHLFFLKNYWRAKFPAKTYLDQLGISKEGVHITFVPDPLLLRNMAAMIGFDEEAALDDLLGVLGKLAGDVKLLVKPHPLQQIDRLQACIRNSKQNNCMLLADADPLELVNASDLVVGFYSNLLLEADAIGKKVIRYFPGYPAMDPMMHKISLEKAVNKIELLQKIKKAVHG